MHYFAGDWSVNFQSLTKKRSSKGPKWCPVISIGLPGLSFATGGYPVRSYNHHYQYYHDKQLLLLFFFLSEISLQRVRKIKIISRHGPPLLQLNDYETSFTSSALTRYTHGFFCKRFFFFYYLRLFYFVVICFPL